MSRSAPTAIDDAVAQLRCRLGQEVTKYASNGKHCVACALVAANQEGELSARGTAVARLPSRTG